MKFGVSDTYAMTGVYLNDAYTSKATNQGVAFPAQPGFSQVIPIYFNNLTMDTWVQASFGYQGVGNFTLNLNGTSVAWSQNCTYSETGFSCSEYPVYADPYFNTTDRNFTGTYQTDVSGYQNLTCLNYQQAVCLNTTNTSEYLCSSVPDDFCVADVVSSDHFNRAQYSYNGIVGLGASSPIWSIMNATTSNSSLPNQFQIQMSNLTDWSFADASYTPTVLDSTLILGNMDMSVYGPQAFALVQDTPLDGIKLETFEFGRYYSSNQSYSAQSIFAQNSDSQTMNNALLSPDIRGLGLPVDSYLKLANYLSIVTNGNAQCFS